MDYRSAWVKRSGWDQQFVTRGFTIHSAWDAWIRSWCSPKFMSWHEHSPYMRFKQAIDAGHGRSSCWKAFRFSLAVQPWFHMRACRSTLWTSWRITAHLCGSPRTCLRTDATTVTKITLRCSRALAICGEKFAWTDMLQWHVLRQFVDQLFLACGMYLFHACMWNVFFVLCWVLSTGGLFLWWLWYHGLPRGSGHPHLSWQSQLHLNASAGDVSEACLDDGSSVLAAHERMLVTPVRREVSCAPEEGGTAILSSCVLVICACLCGQDATYQHVSLISAWHVYLSFMFSLKHSVIQEAQSWSDGRWKPSVCQRWQWDLCHWTHSWHGTVGTHMEKSCAWSALCFTSPQFRLLMLIAAFFASMLASTMSLSNRLPATCRDIRTWLCLEPSLDMRRHWHRMAFFFPSIQELLWNVLRQLPVCATGFVCHSAWATLQPNPGAMEVYFHSSGC